MNARRRTLLAGLLVASAYLAGAAFSGHLSPLTRRPLLDGFTTLPAYRWVNPPPALRSGNKPPGSASRSFTFAGGSLKGGVVSPNDLQITLILQDGSIAPSAGQTSVRVTVAPVDPATLGPAPLGLSFDGNAYRVQASYEPGGAAVSTLTIEADLALVYPADATFGSGSLKHVILVSKNAASWDVLSSVDLPLPQQASAKAGSLGYFVVGRSGGGTAKGSSRSFLPLVVAGVVVLLILLLTSPRVIRRLRRKRDLDDPWAG